MESNTLTRDQTDGKSAVEKERDLVLTTLAKLGGGLPQDDDLVREGTKLILPATWEIDDGIKYLRDYKTRDDQLTVFDRTFPYRPMDGARALNLAIKKAFGMSARRQPPFFG